MLLPTREVERRLLRRHDLVAGIDEVGRGALAGPVSVGVAVVGRATRGRFPDGLRDSKLLPPGAREELCAPIRAWVAGSAVGHATPGEIDDVGIIAALRLAASRALATVRADGLGPTAAILDGTHNWLVPDLFSDDTARDALAFDEVVMRVKADAQCAVVAAASVLAKVERDSLMAGLADPGYGWARNKGYGAATHLEGLARLGPCEHHRRSWNLPRGTVSAPGGMMDG
ncbi:MAG: ribonuclease HII [Actinomycetes bacterium]|nr:ribonuclease HII [Actinomycetes bacterium]MDX5381180.1 ribonuclease HII [Actinomycetes bacterium]MDX5400464.1 ribonuclease HII [Actinomycetes bacterium]MDX5450947.1 ribonuclease HII [Actinomycetes bacterium]